ncbi:DUF3293 domain-containing protein [Rhodococcus marinonascens]|uniref:DUF3293 domain-containing protein n=1 Tax=Rhodococcus marinonascens TaxID=38311 RepID=UPI00093267B7|nr:DUF3293 domain-containing protein [Rhodococcus marinonascens]
MTLGDITAGFLVDVVVVNAGEVEHHQVEQFSVAAQPATTRQRSRTEGQLQNTYLTYLRRIGHQVSGRRITFGDTTLVVDLFDDTNRELIEVKATIDRATMRTALGQILDYARYLEHSHRSILLPEEPAEEMIELLHDHGVSVIWVSGVDFAVRRCPASLAASAANDVLWQDYSEAVVDIHLPTGAVRIIPTDDAAGHTRPPAGPLHIIAACQPGELPGTERERESYRRLTEYLCGRGLEPFATVGGAQDGTYQELSVAVSGLTDDHARKIGCRFGQVAVFSWNSTQWTLLACASYRSAVHRWILAPSPPPARELVATETPA